jgi:RNase P/RNase MRP subunit p30
VSKKLEKEALKYYDKVVNINFVEGTRKNFDNRKKCYFKDLELIEKKDSFHYRRGGLNQILCRLVARHGKIVFFNLNLLKDSKGFSREVLIGRMKQNIRLCRKFKVQMKAGFFPSSKEEIKNPEDVKGLLIVLGMTPLEAKNALEF